MSDPFPNEKIKTIVNKAWLISEVQYKGLIKDMKGPAEACTTHPLQ